MISSSYLLDEDPIDILVQDINNVLSDIVNRRSIEKEITVVSFLMTLGFPGFKFYTQNHTNH